MIKEQNLDFECESNKLKTNSSFIYILGRIDDQKFIYVVRGSMDPGGGYGVRGAGSSPSREGGGDWRRRRSEMALCLSGCVLLWKVEVQSPVHA